MRLSLVDKHLTVALHHLKTVWAIEVQLWANLQSCGFRIAHAPFVLPGVVNVKKKENWRFIKLLFHDQLESGFIQVVTRYYIPCPVKDPSRKMHLVASFVCLRQRGVELGLIFMCYGWTLEYSCTVWINLRAAIVYHLWAHWVHEAQLTSHSCSPSSENSDLVVWAMKYRL